MQNDGLWVSFKFFRVASELARRSAHKWVGYTRIVNAAHRKFQIDLLRKIQGESSGFDGNGTIG